MVDAKSPKPSTVRIAASSNGDGKNALATWAWWCSTLWNCAPTPAPSAVSSSPFTSFTFEAFSKRAFRYVQLVPCRRVRIAFAPRFAFGSRPIATWSRSPAESPASARHQAADSAGNPAQCLTRLKRSSSAAQTSAPSTTSAAAASP